MDLAHRLRISLAATLAVAASAAIATPAASAGQPVAQLLPDLETVEPAQDTWLKLRFNKGIAVLRIANTIGNSGDGPFELRGETPPPGSPCIPGQYEDGDDRTAVQRIYLDDGSGVYEPGIDTDYNQVTAGCYEWHAKHFHWHFQNFSQYQLEDLKTGDLVAGPSEKIGFCIVDQTNPFGNDLPGMPDDGIYPQGSGCNDPDDPASAMGLSIGYADTYTLNTAGQRLAIPGIEKGRYCLVSTAVPPGGSSVVEESNPDNNDRRRKVRINPDKKDAEDLGPCPA